MIYDDFLALALNMTYRYNEETDGPDGRRPAAMCGKVQTTLELGLRRRTAHARDNERPSSGNERKTQTPQESRQLIYWLQDFV